MSLIDVQIEAPAIAEKNRNQEDIMSVLMELEKPSAKAQVDSSDDEAAARSLLDQITPAATTIQPQLDYSKTSFSYIPSCFIYLR